MEKIHINCDLGEGGKFDEQLMPLISACNIACGGHAGNLESMHYTVDLALENDVEIGAHPSYPDKKNFGRISLEFDPKELRRSIVAQILTLKQITEAEGGKLTHIKPHGALYNDAQKNKTVAAIILDAIEEFDDPLLLYAPEDSLISQMAQGRVEIFYEAFADRNYNPDRSLVSRLNPDALITQKEQVFSHLFSAFRNKIITCINGEKIRSNASTFCLHSDTPNSIEIIKFFHRKFGEKGIKIKNT